MTKRTDPSPLRRLVITALKRIRPYDIARELYEGSHFGNRKSRRLFTRIFQDNVWGGNESISGTGAGCSFCPMALADAGGYRSFSMKVNRNTGQSTLEPDEKYAYDVCIEVYCQSGGH